MKKSLKKELLDLLDEAEFTNRPKDYAKVLDFLAEIKDQHMKDSEYYYYHGYTALSFPDKEDFYRKMAQKSFEKSLELNPQNDNAYFHLIDCHYELGHFASAVEGYTEVLKRLQDEEGSVHVRLSVFQRILVSYLHLNWHGKFIGNYDVWIRAFRSIQEIEEMTLPRDLIIAVADYLKHKGDRISPELGKKFKNVTIDLLSILNHFPLAKKNYKDQIESLKNWDGQYSGPYILELV